MLQNRRLAFLALLIFIISFALRIYILATSNLIIDDFYITLRVAKNFVLGHGLVYNIHEYIYPVTSVFYTIICSGFLFLFGDGAIPGLRLFCGTADSLSAVVLFLIVNSIFKSERSDYYGYTLGIFSALSYSAVSSVAIVNIFGLETPLYILCIAFCFYTYQKKQFRISMMLAGLTAIVRPDGVLLFIAIIFYSAVVSKEIRFKHTLFFFLPYAGFFAFVYSYYNSIIPQAVIAKSLVSNSVFDEWSLFLSKFFISYKSVIPGLLFLAGCYFSVRNKKAVSLLIWCTIYAILFSTFVKWWVWYFPPFIFAYWIILTIGIDGLIEKLKGRKVIVNFLLAAMLLVPVIMLTDTVIRVKQLQKTVPPYIKQTNEIADWLNENISNDEKVLVEPLGRIGYFAFDKTFSDYPGLVSREVTNSLSRFNGKVWGSPMDDEAMRLLIAEVKPEVLILRESEYKWLLRKKVIDNYSMEFISYIDTTEIIKNYIVQDMFILKSRN